MGSRSRSTFKKWQRELALVEKQREKAATRAQRKLQKRLPAVFNIVRLIRGSGSRTEKLRRGDAKTEPRQLESMECFEEKTGETLRKSRRRQNCSLLYGKGLLLFFLVF
jgi:hypothetical protein